MNTFGGYEDDDIGPDLDAFVKPEPEKMKTKYTPRPLREYTGQNRTAAEIQRDIELMRADYRNRGYLPLNVPRVNFYGWYALGFLIAALIAWLAF